MNNILVDNIYGGHNLLDHKFNGQRPSGKELIATTYIQFLHKFL